MAALAISKPGHHAQRTEAVNPLITVVICTYNRASMLSNVLSDLAHQTLKNSEFEVLVVDNNSTDSTRDVVEGQQDITNLRYILESVQNLCEARNRGSAEASGLYIVYFDDDVRLPEGWLARAKVVIQEQQPDSFGGPYRDHCSGSKPHWFREAYIQHPQLGQSRALSSGEYLSGMNMAFRSTLLHDLEGFNPRYGMRGYATVYGDDTDLFIRMRRQNPDALVYCDVDLCVDHVIRSEKMTILWLAGYRLATAKARYSVFEHRHLAERSVAWLRWRSCVESLGLVGDLMRGILRRDRRRYPAIQNFLYEYAFRHLDELGAIRAELELRTNPTSGSKPAGSVSAT
jgi:glycosyltransferase involved in cell wall biosynthesis